MQVLKIYYLLPIFFVTGPFLPDLVITTSSLFFIIYFLKYERQYLVNNFFYFFLVFYLFIIFSSLNSNDFIFSLKSSLPYVRIIIFPLIIYYLLEKKILNLITLSKILLFVIIFLSLDSIYQFIFGYNVIGFKSPLNYRVTSFFNDEAILGSYISKILPLLISIYIYINHKSKDFSAIIYYVTFFLGIICIFLSGDRMPFGTILLYIILINIFYFEKKQFILLLSLIFAIIVLISLNNSLKNRYINMTLLQLFEGDIKIDKKFQIDEKNIEEKFNFELKNILNNKILFFSRPHQEHLKTAYSIFKDNKIIGSGPNTFRLNCTPKFHEHQSRCSTHPHNIYIQLLSETGIIGFIFLISIFFYFVYKIFYSSLNKDRLQVFIFAHLFVSIFPISTYGNFFNNYNSIMLFFPVGFYLYMLKNNKNYKTK